MISAKWSHTASGFQLQCPTGVPHPTQACYNWWGAVPAGYTMIEIFIDVVLPVFLMAGAGVVLRRVRQVPAGPISQVTLYIFAPCLVFHSLANTALSTGELGKIAGFTLALAVVIYPLSLIAARGLRLDRATTSGFLLTTLFMNAGNYGLPVALFAFGEAGVERAVVFFVTQATLAGTLAVFVASRSQLDARGALLSVLRMPLIYGSLGGIGVNLLGLELPTTVAEPLRILGAAAVPSMLLVLGLQIADRFSLEEPRALVVTCFIRLLVSGAIAYLITLAIGFDGQTQQVLIVVSSMPTAVMTTILATEFYARPTFVTSAVVVSTLGSMVTLTVLISLVQELL